MTDITERIRERTVTTDDGCWEWTGGGTNNGYGCIQYGGKTWLVHRLMYSRVIAPIPDGMQIDHLCRNRACANPEHMEVVTPGENTRRGETGKWQRPDTCSRGHAFTEENTYRYGNHRACRTCRRMHSRNWKLRQKEACNA